MNLQEFFADEDAVSPVIGVILMVAITVILAAVIGTFVLGLGENVQDSAPQANFQFEYVQKQVTAGGSMEDGVSITHTGGEDVEASTVTVQVGGAEAWSSSGFNAGNFFGNTTDAEDTVFGSTISTGSTLDVYELDQDSNDVITGGDSVRVVWTSPSGGTSNTIGQSTVPN
ncbi:type IV pilin [Halorarius litoreus]|uniref:type IV pilin n=1 Tax=Halorarius litoreus TaxID=2962676 RepID=UPI0020CD89F1|nr:type IV pilin N-terminal domain-containing protein [Halorarius litoreus]